MPSTECHQGPKAEIQNHRGLTFKNPRDKLSATLTARFETPLWLVPSWPSEWLHSGSSGAPGAQ